MRILFANSTHRWGGVKSWTLATGRGLRDRGHEIALVLRPGDPFAEAAAGAGLAVETRAWGPDFNPLAIVRFVRQFRAWRPDLVVTNVGKDNRIAGLAARLAGIPVLQRVGRRGDILDRAVNRWAHRQVVSHIVVPSEATRQDLLRHRWVRPEEVTVIPNGVDLERWAPGRGAGKLRGEIGAAPGELLIATTGQLTAVKGQRDLIEAVATLAARGRPIRLVLIGRGREEEALRRRAGELGIGRLVHFAGFRRDLDELLEDADVAVQPSLVEGLPHSVVEFMAKGRAIVASGVDGILEAVEDGRTALVVPPGDPPALARAIERLQDDPELRRRLAGAARLRAEVELFGAADGRSGGATLRPGDPGRPARFPLSSAPRRPGEHLPRRGQDLVEGWTGPVDQHPVGRPDRSEHVGVADDEERQRRNADCLRHVHRPGVAGDEEPAASQRRGKEPERQPGGADRQPRLEPLEDPLLPRSVKEHDRGAVVAQPPGQLHEPVGGPALGAAAAGVKADDRRPARRVEPGGDQPAERLGLLGRGHRKGQGPAARPGGQNAQQVDVELRGVTPLLLAADQAGVQQTLPGPAPVAEPPPGAGDAGQKAAREREAVAVAGVDGQVVTAAPQPPGDGNQPQGIADQRPLVEDDPVGQPGISGEEIGHGAAHDQVDRHAGPDRVQRVEHRREEEQVADPFVGTDHDHPADRAGRWRNGRRGSAGYEMERQRQERPAPEFELIGHVRGERSRPFAPHPRPGRLVSGHASCQTDAGRSR